MQVIAYFNYNLNEVADFIEIEVKHNPERSKEQNTWNGIQAYLESFNSEDVQLWLTDEQMNEIYDNALKQYHYWFEMDDEPYDIDSDVGYDPYSGTFSNDC